MNLTAIKLEDFKKLFLVQRQLKEKLQIEKRYLLSVFPKEWESRILKQQ